MPTRSDWPASSKCQTSQASKDAARAGTTAATATVSGGGATGPDLPTDTERLMVLAVAAIAAAVTFGIRAIRGRARAKVATGRAAAGLVARRRRRGVGDRRAVLGKGEYSE